MNHKLVQSLAQIILSLSDEERQYLEREVRKYFLKRQVEELETKLKTFEEIYRMRSEHFHRRFQAGELGDSIDFFEWNTYYEILTEIRRKESQLNS